jgi:glutamate---cysteine ligase / carboxylate-amine ligase
MVEGLSADGWRALVDAVSDHTIGVEEELMLLDPETLDLLPAAARVRAELGEAISLRTELPAAQVETASPVCATIAEAAASLTSARRALATGVAGWAQLAGAGTHPFADPEGALIEDPKYAHLIAEFPWVLPRQLVFGQHVHVAVRGADRALAVHNALRSYLPDLAALAGNAPLHAGRDTGLASLRPKICDLLPRQGVPPAWASWEERAAFGRWGRAGGVFPGAGEPWYELRVHDEHGTIELRVPDSQSTAEEAAGVLALAAALVAWLAERHDAGERLPVHDAARIAENRWRAMRHGLAGTLLDLDSGEPQPARDRLRALIDAVAPVAERLGGAAELAHARTLADRNGAERQRELAAERGVRGVAEWLAGAFAP